MPSLPLQSGRLKQNKRKKLNMKKMLALAAVAAFAGSATAASLSWGWGSGSLFVANEGDTSGVAAASFKGDTSNISLVLVYLGSSSTFTAADVTADKVVDSIAYGFSGDDGESFWNPQNKTFSVTEAGGYSAGDNFGIAVKVGDTYTLALDISDWDNGTLGSAIAPVAKVSSLAANAPVTQLKLSEGFTTDNAAAVVVPPSVPEPGIACMALLGIGMMIKRRRA